MLSAPAKLGATLYVPSQYSTIQAAINAAYNGDTILVSPGTYYENLRWENKSLKLNGWGAETTIVDGGHKGRCLYMANVPDTARVRGFTFTHGDTASLVQPGGSLPGV
jgi:pectin methylesterase-like acyl-CoA thioesterase